MDPAGFISALGDESSKNQHQVVTEFVEVKVFIRSKNLCSIILGPRYSLHRMLRLPPDRAYSAIIGLNTGANQLY